MKDIPDDSILARCCEPVIIVAIVSQGQLISRLVYLGEHIIFA